MSNNTPVTDPIIEEVIEQCLRLAIRDSLNSVDLNSTKISCFWLGEEQGTDNAKGKEPPYVFIMARPNTYSGFQMPIRTVNVEITIVTLQDDDIFTGQLSKRNIYAAVRRVFDDVTYVFTSPIVCHALQIIGSDVGEDEEGRFERASITVEIQLSV